LSCKIPKHLLHISGPMRTSKNSVPLIPLKDFSSSPFLEHGIFIEAFENCVSVRHKRMEVHRHDYVELFWLDCNGSVLIDFENYPLSGKSLIAIGPGRVHAWQVGVTYCLKHGIETAQPHAPRLQLINRIQIETPSVRSTFDCNDCMSLVLIKNPAFFGLLCAVSN
jgi:hypothetical protein